LGFPGIAAASTTIPYRLDTGRSVKVASQERCKRLGTQAPA
jgi:hypothetical protein